MAESIQIPGTLSIQLLILLANAEEIQVKQFSEQSQNPNSFDLTPGANLN